MRGKIRTFIDLFLRQVPLRLGYTHVICGCRDSNPEPPVSYTGALNSIELHPRENSGRQDLNLRVLDPKSSPCGHLWNTLVKNFGERIRTHISWFRARRPARLDDPEK